MIRLAGAAPLALLAACATPNSLGSENVVLIEPAQGAALLAQCSRPGPTSSGSFFTPAPSDITALEGDLAALLLEERASYLREGDPAGAFGWPLDPSGYVRQYVGYESGGRRMIYGNFLPGDSASGPARPAVVCDGGPRFFGVEYDIAAQQVVRVAFNGGLGGPFYEPIDRPVD